MDTVELKLLLNQEYYLKQKDYWTEKLIGNIGTVCLSGAKNNKCFENAEFSYIFEDEFAKRVKKLAKDSKIAIYAIMSTILTMLLNRYSMEEDIMFVSPLYGEEHKEKEINNFVLIRNMIRRTQCFKECLMQMKKCLMDSYNNQDYPLDMLYQLEKSSYIGCSLDGLHHEPSDDILKTAELFFKFKVENEALSLNITYKNDLFTEERVEDICRSYSNLLKSMLEDPDKEIGLLNMISEDTIKSQLSGVFTELDDFISLKEMFEKQVQLNGEKTAYVCGNEEISYHSLNEKANRVASFLQSKNLQVGEFVGVMFPRSIHMMVAIQGIIKSGLAYVPIDISYPVNRINYILRDSKITYLLVQEDILQDINVQGVECINIKELDLDEYSKENPNTEIDKSKPAYVLYTSGSTGNPKGVVIGNEAVSNFRNGMIPFIGLSEHDCMLALTTICFDISFLELLYPLTLGAKVVIATEEESSNIEKLVEVAEKNYVNILQATPYRFFIMLKYEQFTKFLKKIDCICSTGERFPEGLYPLLSAHTNAKIVNCYGPTETCIYSTIKYIESEQDITIGTPIVNTDIYILDEQLRILPAGAKGHLFIGGRGLALGYLNKSELTQEKFIINPGDGKQIYQTGDVAYINTNDEIVYIGRVDNQIKLRGFRVELGEIENCIKKHLDIKDAVTVIQTDDKKIDHIVAFIVSDKQIFADEMHTILEQYLPYYMIPSFFVQLEKIPLMQNGKADRKGLAENRDYIQNMNQYVEPENETQKELVQIWSNILHIDYDKVGIDHLFMDLGGNSIQLVQMHQKLVEKYHTELSVTDLFKYKTIREIIKHLEEKNDLLKELNGIQLDDSYVPTEVYDNTVRNKKIELETVLVEKLYHVSNVMNIEITDILAAVFSYLLYEISKEETAYVYVSLLEDKFTDIFKEIRIDLSDIENINEFLMYIHLGYQNADQHYKLADLMEKKPKRNHYLISYVYDRRAVSGNFDLLELFDFILHMEKVMEETVVLKFTYRPRKIREDLFDRLVVMFKDILNEIFQEMK